MRVVTRASERAVAPSDQPDAGALRLVSGLSLFLPIVLVGHWVSELLRYRQVGVAVFFLPYAALTAALILAPRRDWVWYIVVDVAVSVAAHSPRLGLSRVAFAQVADVTQALLATTLLRSLSGGRPRFDSVGGLLRFLLGALVVAPAVGAALGGANIVAHDPSKTFGRAWLGWFVSGGLTGLSMLPALLLVFLPGGVRRRRVDPARATEGAAIAAALAATCWLSLTLGTGAGWRVALALYAPLPALIWTALRFGAGATSVALTALTFAAVIGADRGAGPFLPLSLDERILAVQLFVVLTSVPVLFIAAISSARRAVVELHRAALASMHAHVAVLDGRGTVVEVNESWRRIAESPGASTCHRAGVGDNYVDVCRAAAERGDAAAARTVDGVVGVLSGGSRLFEMEYGAGGGDARECRYALTVEGLALPAGGAFVRRADVTAQHRARVQIEEQRRELTHLARVSALGQLSGALAHELNQPLSSILGNAEAARLLLQRRDVDREQLAEILQDIVVEDQRAAEVIRRLRAMLKRGETRLQPLDAAELIGEVLQLAHAELVTRGVSTTTSVAPDLPPVLGDRVQLQQVLLNLILNACEAMASAPAPTRSLHMTATAGPDGAIQVSIRDSGPGIAPAIADRLFEPFATTKPEGLGLGLSISRTIVASHGGRLWAENDVEGGATVHCLLKSARAPNPVGQP
jgi:signal transduction histidine kinase/integral membrane sensor domain MASE1